MTNASALHLRHRERAADGSPETIADIITRARFAAEWHQNKATKERAQARGFSKLSKVEEYTLQQREDAVYAAAHCFGAATVHEDTARTLDSIADALVYVVG
jgi:hypothetical protein